MKNIKKILTSKKFIFIACSVIIVIGICLFLLIPKKTAQTKKTETVKTAIKPSPVVLSDKDEKIAESNSPTSGPLQYEYIDTYYSDGSKTPKFLYYTTERTDDRLINLNDAIIVDLKKSGKIDDNTPSYSIDMFNDKTIAKMYFSMVNNAITTAEKLKLKNNYIAQYAFNKALKLKMLIKISTAKILRKN